MDDSARLGNNEMIIRMKYKNIKSISENKGSFLITPHVEKYEGFGEIVKLGSDIKGFQILDMVVFVEYSSSPWADIVVTTVEKIMKVPKDFDPVEASRKFKDWYTAYRLLIDFGNHKVLIQNASESSTGRAVIHLARLLGIESICIMASKENTDCIKSELVQVGATHVYTEEEFQTIEVHTFVKSLKPTFCLDAVGGTMLNSLCHCLDFNSTVVTYSANSTNRISISPFLLISMNIKLFGFWLPLWINQNNYKAKIEMILHLEMLWLMNF